MLWEHAADAATTNADWAAASRTPAGPATTTQQGNARAAARAQAIAGRALRRWGRHAEAREQLTAALECCGHDPDADTVPPWRDLAIVEVFAGSPDADRLTTEALSLGQALASARASSPACS